MPDLPAPGPTESDFHDHVDTLDALDSPVGSYVDQQIEREAEDREAIDILQGLRAIQTSDPVRWTIERVDGEGEAGLLAKWPTLKLKWENIRDEFGPGTYAIEGRTIRGKYIRRTTLTIASDSPRKAKPTDMQSFNVTEFLAQQEARDRLKREEDERRDRERQEREDKRAEKREQLILAGLPAFATVLAAMFGRPQLDVGALAAAMRPAPGPDPLAMIAALKQLAPEPAPAGKDPMATAITLFELLADKAGNNGARADWLDVVKEGVKVLGPSVGGAIEQTIVQARENAAAAQQNGAAHGTPQNAPAALPAPSANAHIQQAASEAGMLDLLPHLSWLKTQLAKLAGAAHRNRDPELYAAMFLEELPNGLTPQRVLELLSRSDWLAQLARFEPSINDTIAPWWNQLRECLFAMIHEAAAVAMAPKKSAPEPRAGEVERPQAMPSLTGE
jgi:hypothetical protein